MLVSAELYVLHRATLCIAAIYFILHFIFHRVSIICECMYAYVCVIFNVSSPATETE